MIIARIEETGTEIILIDILEKDRIEKVHDEKRTIIEKECKFDKNGNLHLPSCITSIGEKGTFGFEEGKLLSNYEQMDRVKHIIVPKSVKHIISRFFKRFNNLEKVAFEEGTQIKKLESLTFDGCSKLKSVIIPDSVTDIGAYAFLGCTSLESLATPKGSTIEVTEDMFTGMNKLQELHIMGKVKLIKLLQYRNNPYGWILSRRLSSNRGETVNIITKEMVNVLKKECPILRAITIPDGIKEIGNHAFSGYKSLKRVSLSEGLEIIGGAAFKGCHSLEKITMPNSLKKIKTVAFFCCNNLAEVTIPKGVSVIEPGAFYGCEKLKKVVIQEGTEEIADLAFSQCYNLEKLTLPKGLKIIGNAAFQSCSNIKKLKLPEGIRKIKGNAFIKCFLITVQLPSNMVSIDETAFDKSVKFVKEQDFER